MNPVYSEGRRCPPEREHPGSVSLRRHNKRKTVALARLLTALDSEARREQAWRPRRAYRISVGR
jgi:hypothetical protein